MNADRTDATGFATIIAYVIVPGSFAVVALFALAVLAFLDAAW